MFLFVQPLSPYLLHFSATWVILPDGVVKYIQIQLKFRQMTEFRKSYTGNAWVAKNGHQTVIGLGVLKGLGNLTSYSLFYFD